MDDEVWGVDEPALTTAAPDEPLPPRLAALVALTGRLPLAAGEAFPWPSAHELPEVRRLRASGFRPLEPAPLWLGLPAVWPREHRGWVADRLPRVLVHSSGTDGPRWVSPRDEGLTAELAQEAAHDARELDLPAPPPGRIWLLRSPWPSLGVAVVLGLVWRRCEERGLLVAHTGLTEAAREVLAWDESRAWSALTPGAARAARGWRAEGRHAEDVADLVIRDLGPAESARLAELGLGGADALAWVDAVTESGADAVEQVAAWLSAGVPLDTASRRPDLLVESQPTEVVRWLKAGFRLDEVAVAMPLEAALAWRASGVTHPDAVRLLRADPRLTPQEAAAFDSTGTTGDERLAWVEHGFDAASARAWREVGLYANEARVWRSAGLGPAQARDAVAAGSLLPPVPGPLIWTSLRSDARPHRHYGVEDPPGTRGRIAARARHQLWG